jgi:hypothetical protein
MDAGLLPVSSDTTCGPTLVLSSSEAHSVERRGDVLIGPFCCHVTNNFISLITRSTGVLARFRLSHSHLGVLSTAPMDNEHHFSLGLINISDDFFDECPHESLPRAHVNAWFVPCGF